MLANRSFVKKTRKGAVVKVVREHYLRDDIPCGSLFCQACDPGAAVLAADAAVYVVPDTNVALHQLDLLESGALTDVVVLTTVLEETKHRNRAAYDRLRTLCAAGGPAAAAAASPQRRVTVFANEHHAGAYVGPAAVGESPNDRNDRAVRAAATWMRAHLGEAAVASGGAAPRVILLTDDAACRAAAVAESGDGDAGASPPLAVSCAEYVASHLGGRADLLDLLAAPGAGMGDDDAENSGGGGAGGGSRKRRALYRDHLSAVEMAAGLASGAYHQGTLRVSRYSCTRGVVGSESAGRDIAIGGWVDMNRAVDGDRVCLELLPESQWRPEPARLPAAPGPKPGPGGEGGATVVPGGDDDDDGGDGDDDDDGVNTTAGLAPHVAGSAAATAEAVGGVGPSAGVKPTGRVVGILKRTWRSVCGALVSSSTRPGAGGVSRALFQPSDARLPRVRLSTRQGALLADKRIVVAMDAWAVTERHPRGHLVRTLDGRVGDKATETEVLLLENDIQTAPFTPAVHACVPPVPWAASAAEMAQPGREDFRGRAVCSVDPPGCRDIDDALHAVTLPNGNWEVGVHIADVGHFIVPGSPLDLEAGCRGTSVYLVDRRIDMLPKPLTEDICSLRCGAERLTFSVVWEMTPQAVVVATRFTKGLIRSAAALSYQEAQARMDDPRLGDPVTSGLRALLSLAQQLRARRAAAGALTLASAEVKFQLDTETQDPLDVGMYAVRPANHMVEEFMLLANIAVAGRILQSYPALAVLRRHPVPSPEMLEPLQQVAAAAGVTLDASSSLSLAKSLDAATRAADPYFNTLLRILTTRCMTQAVYCVAGDVSAPELVHYGLASPIYTHFTSPIRRYADLVVHRLLAAALGLDRLPAAAADRPAARSLVDNLNVRHHNAQLAGRASVELHTVLFFRGRTTVADARVVKVRSNGLVAFVPKYGIEGLVWFTAPPVVGAKRPAAGAPGVRKPGDWDLDAGGQAVTSPDGTKRYTVLDRITVRLSVVETEPNRERLQLQLVDPGVGAASDS